MKHGRYLCLLVPIFGVVVSWAADNRAIGKWDCVSDDGHGAVRNWVLVVAEFRGKLSGSFVSVEEGESLPLIDPAFQDPSLSFKAYVNPNCTLFFKLKLDNNKLDGTFDCPEVSGTLRGTKSPANGAGKQ